MTRIELKRSAAGYPYTVQDIVLPRHDGDDRVPTPLDGQILIPMTSMSLILAQFADEMMAQVDTAPDFVTPDMVETVAEFLSYLAVTIAEDEVNIAAEASAARL